MPGIGNLHIGRKIECIRMLRGVKQENLASELGITQAAISKMERSAKVSTDKLILIAKALGVTVETIKNFNGDLTINDNSSEQNNAVAHTHFSPIEKLVELFEENKMLYERLLKSEKEKNEMLEMQLNLKKDLKQ